MLFDFSGAELTDEQKEVLKNNEVQGVLKGFYDKREANTVKLWKDKVAEFRDTNISEKEAKEALESKIAKLTEQLESKDSGDDTKEVARLTRELADATAKNEQYEGITKEKDDLISTLNSDKERSIIERQVVNGITEYNKKFPAMPIKEDKGAREWIIEKALKQFKVNEDGKGITPFESDGSPIGNMSPADWLGGTFREDNKICYDTPTGSGASGGNNTSGAGTKTMSRSEFDAIADPSKKIEVAKSYTLTE